MLWTRTAAAVAALGILGGAGAFAAPGEKERDGRASAASGPARAAYEAAEQKEHERRAFRNSEAGQRERAKSRTRYRGQSDAEALATTRSRFPRLVSDPPLKWPPLRDGQKLARYLNGTSALIEEPGGGRSVLESTLPLVGRTPGGGKEPIDLALSDMGAAFAPKSSGAAVRLPKDSRGSVRFLDEHFGIALDGAEAGDATLNSNKLFYGNALADTDLVVEPVPTGAEISLVLRSPDSPTKPALAFDLPQDARLRLTSLGDDAPLGSAEIVRSGKRVALVGPAIAADAQGESVPVGYEVDGDRLVMKVDTSGGVAYPVMVDPTTYVRDENGQSTCPPGVPLPCSPRPAGYDWPGWFSWSSRAQSHPCPYPAGQPFYQCKNGDGALYVYGFANTSYASNDRALWQKNARPGTYIFRYDAANMSMDVSNSARFSGICQGHCVGWPTNGQWFSADPNSWENRPYRYISWHGERSRYEYYCINSSHGEACTPQQPANDPNALNNAVVFGLIMYGPSGSTQPFAAMGGAATYSADNSSPETTVTHSNPVPSGWVESYTDTATVRAVDNAGANQGVGMGTIDIVSDGQLPHSTCRTSDVYDTCPTDWTAPGITNTAPEGVKTYTASSTDIVGNNDPSRNKSWTVKSDRSRPDPYTTERGKWFPDGDHRVPASVFDEHSGVRESSLYVAPVSDHFNRTTTSGWGSADQVADAPASRVARWRLNEPSGTRAADSAFHPQLVTNPSFETDRSGWAVTGGFFLATSSIVREADSGAPDGAHVGKVVTPASWQAGTGTDFSVTAGQSYRVRVKLKRADGGSNLRIALGEIASPHEELVVQAVVSPSSSGYTEYTGVVTPTRSGTYRLYVRTTNNIATTFYVDAASVREENGGTYTGGYTLNEPGATPDGDRAVRLNGTTGHVNAGNPTGLKLANGTVEAWVKAPSPGSSYRGVVVKQWAYGLFLLDGVVATHDWGTGLTRSTGVSVADGNWHHVAMSFRSGVPNGTVIYVDGVARLTTTITVYDQNTGLTLGSGGGPTQQYLAGTIDDAAVYNAPLTAEQIHERYRGRAWIVDEGQAGDFTATPANGGKIDFPSGAGFRSASLYGARIKNVDVSTRIKFAQTTTGSGVGSFAYVTLRRQPNGGDNYRVGLVATDGNMLLVRGARTEGGVSQPAFIDQDTGLGFARDRWYRLRVVALTDAAGTSSTIYVKYWLDGATEPVAWNVVTTQAGGPHGAGGVGVRVAGGSTSAQQYYYDDFRAIDRDGLQAQQGRKPDGSLCDTASGCATTMSHPYALNTAGFADGPIDVVAIASDPVNYAPGSNTELHRRWDDWQVQLDRSAPTMTNTGTLRNPGDGVVYDEEDYNLRVDAKDEAASGARSGVKSIELLVDDRDPHPASGDYRRVRSGSSCDSCGWVQDFVWRAEEYSAGRHKLTVKVTDFAGNVATDEWFVTIHRPGALNGMGFVSPDRTGLYSPEDESEADDVNVNVATGNLLLSEPDANPEFTADAEDIDLVRYANSVSPATGTHGLRWTGLAGADLRLRKNDDNSITFFGPSHSIVRFARNADGTYAASNADATLVASSGTYTVTTNESGEQYTFDCDSCRARTIHDAGGNRTTFSYRADGTPQSATDELGRTTTFTVDSERRITRIDAPGSRVHRYTYDAAGMLETYTSPSDAVTRYAYDASRRLTEVSRPGGPTTRFTYSGAQGGRRVASMTRVTDASTGAGQTTTFSYALGGDGSTTTTVNEPSSASTTYVSRADGFTDSATSGASPPTVSLSGALWDRRDNTLADDGTTYPLSITASDGSGVKSIEVLVDGEQEDFVEQSGTGGLSRTYTLDPQDFPTGMRIVTVRALDNDGHMRTTQLRVTLLGAVSGVAASTDAADEGPADDVTIAESTDTSAPRSSANQPLLDQQKADAKSVYQLSWPSAPMSVATASGLQPATATVPGANRDGLGPGGQPPDPTGAIGHDHYVQMINFRIQAYDRNLDPARSDGPVPLDRFARDDGVYDPQIVWDESSDRWFYAAAGGLRTPNERTLVFGWSVTSNPTNFATANRQDNPTGGWCKYVTRASTTQDDFPKLGVSKRHIIIGTNAFRSGSFVRSRLRIARKPRNGQRRCTSTSKERRVKTFNLRVRDPQNAERRYSAFTPVPVNSSSTNANGYVVASAPGFDDDGNATARNTLNLWRVVGKTGRPKLRPGSTAINIAAPPFAAAADAPQGGGNDPADGQPYSDLETQDGRFMQAFGDFDPTGRFVIWTTHEVNAGDGRAVVRWYRIDPRSSTQRNGTLDVPGAFAFYPAIAPGTNGSTVMINYSVANPNVPAEIRARSGTVDANGDLAFGNEIVVAPGESRLSRAVCNVRPTTGSCRWGDYAAATPDRRDPNVVWGSAMRMGPDRNYRTRNFAIRP
ncbi:MAG: hypothetical protein M3340_06025 [Actinomycetota bacterium]|nr:hypothetical protein [Actinomycetota bacterium]